MERKLATIRMISNISSIEGADNIEVAKIGGWQCVVKKNQFQVGDLGVYFEIDSMLPIRDIFEFLRSSCYKNPSVGVEGFRLKTIKLKGTISQGLLMPIHEFPELGSIDLIEGLDATEILNISKWEPIIPVHLAGLVKGNFPSFIRKTNEDRIQNLDRWFETYKEIFFEESVKLDGSSMTSYFNKDYVGVCSHNLDLKEDPNNTFWKLAIYYNLPYRLKAYGKNIAIQGELFGEGIQANRLNIKGQDFRVFNIYSIDESRYLLPEERYEVLIDINKYPGPILKNVPVPRKLVPIFKENTMESLLRHADQINEYGTQQEGFVYKSCSLVKGDIISFKVISNKYLLKSKE